MNEKTNTQNESRPSRTVATLAAVGTVAASAFLLLPRGEDKPAPQPETYTEMAQDSAQTPYDAANDVLVSDNIRISPRNAQKDTPSEAVLSDAGVQTYVVDNPDQSSSLTASSMSLPQAEGYAVVERDIDGDGDTDAVAVPKE